MPPYHLSLSLLLLFACIMGSSSSALAQALPAKEDAAIRSVMDRQQDDWNAGNLEGFMNGYWRSEQLKFVGKTGVTYGWQGTLDRYKRGYPDKATMGKLTFTILHVEKISAKSALVVGKWQLQRAADAPEGHFSLVWKKVNGSWVIVADHSS